MFRELCAQPEYTNGRVGKPAWNRGLKTGPQAKETRQRKSRTWKQKYTEGYVAPNKGRSRPAANKGAQRITYIDECGRTRYRFVREELDGA